MVNKLLDGSLLQGRQIDVDNGQITLYTQGKDFISVDKKEIDEYGMIQESLMPEGLEAEGKLLLMKFEQGLIEYL